jgi:hypothetical protein
MVARLGSTRFPISGSSIRPSAFRRSDFSPLAAASCLNPCYTVAQHKRFLTLVSRFRPFACWPPSQPFYAFHPYHGQPILRSHNTCGSQHRFQRSSLRFSAALLTFLRLPRSTSHITARRSQCFRLHVTRGSRHRFHRSYLCISAARPLSRSFNHASVHLARPKLRRRPDASTSSPDHELHYQCPTPHP